MCKKYVTIEQEEIIENACLGTHPPRTRVGHLWSQSTLHQVRTGPEYSAFLKQCCKQISGVVCMLKSVDRS